MNRPHFGSVQEYGRLFTDAEYWRPYVEEVCLRHKLGAVDIVRSGMPGTFPTFIVNEQVVVKLFGELFDGAQAYRTEVEMYTLLGSDPLIPAPRLLASGSLFEGSNGWCWPYIISEFVQGTSLREVYTRVGMEGLREVSRFAASAMRRIHCLQPSAELSWDGFIAFLEERRSNCVRSHTEWGALPVHLLSQLENYILPVSELVDVYSRPRVMHCDFNADHVLGAFDNERWVPRSVIDFGDAMVGDRSYDLVALHIGLFDCNKNLLRLFLDTYGFDAELSRDLTHKAMSMTLLHAYNVLSDVFVLFPLAASVETLEELASLLWDPEATGLE